MKHLLGQIFRSGKFLFGFVIFIAILLTVLIYPILIPNPPLEIVSRGTFLPPGIYANVYDSMTAPKSYTLLLDEAAGQRIASKLSEEDRLAMKEWLIGNEIAEAEIDTVDTAALLALWEANFDPTVRLPGMTNADRNYYIRLNNALVGLLDTEAAIVASPNEEGELEEKYVVDQTTFVNIGEVANVRFLPLGTDNFGRDVLTELISATGVSLTIGFVAGVVATAIGLTLGMVSGYLGGIVDDVIIFITNLFTVIPSFVLLILISFSIGQESRGAFTIAVVIGFTSWVWTARAVRAQVISLRNRDHVNLSKLSGHSTFHILLTDIFPYIASYVVMALILQISSGILAEAGLSILGLGPRTTEVPTLGLMMNWGMIYQAHVLGKWWAYFPRYSYHCADFVLDEPNEYRSRSSIQSSIKGLSDHMSSNILEVNELTTKYITRFSEDVFAVDHVSLRVEPGRSVGIAGESGCGKSTLALSLMGYYFPPLHYSSGEIIIDGRNITGMKPDDVRKTILGNEIAYIPQAAMNALNPTQRVINFIEDVIHAHHPERSKKEIYELAKERFELLGLPAEVLQKYSVELSGGMKQRTVIATSVILSPKILIADEPSSALGCNLTEDGY